MANWAAAVLRNGLGRYAEALAVAEPAAPARSNGTCARCSPNWASPPAGTSTTPCPRGVSPRPPRA